MPLIVGSIIEIETARLARGGKAVGRIDSGESGGQVVFVDGAAPEEVVRAEVTAVTDRFSEATVVEVVAPSKHRVRPVCPVFDRCGGCTWQHVSYDEQVRQKDQILRETLRRAKAFSDEELAKLQPMIASPKPLHYRSRVTVHIQGGRLGFLKRKSRELVEVDDCPIAAEGLIAYARSLVKSPECRFQVGRDDGGKLFAGGAFTQVNREQNRALQTAVSQAVLDHVDRQPEVQHWHVLDLYAGNGNLTFPIVERVRQAHPSIFVDATGVEGSRESVENAKRSPRAQLCQFEMADVETWFARQKSGFKSQFAKKGVKADEILVLDPPRDGCGKTVMPAIARRKPSLIVYVSCDPATLARDLVRFKQASLEKGIPYELVQAHGFDMFPQTDHIEAVAVFRRRPNGTSLDA